MIFLVKSWTKIMTLNFYSKNLFIRMSRIANFDDIIKIVSMFIKTTYKNSKKKIKKYKLCIRMYLHLYLHLYFLI